MHLPRRGPDLLTSTRSVSNLGGTFPRFFVLKFVDLFTVATCVPPVAAPDAATLKGDLVAEAFSCAAVADQQRCRDGGGICEAKTDGYYVMNVVCVILGALSFWAFIRPAAMKLQGLPLRAWRLAEG